MKQYKLKLPENYKKVIFPGLNEWVAALRSGEYQQGSDLLHNQVKNQYCCLGVLCKVRNEEFHDTYYLDTLNSGYKILRSSGDLPSGVIITYKNNIGNIKRYNLSIINDDGFTFDQIADILEQVYEHEDL
jgi:hypothetical protein